jgi:hypothetical protein
MNTVRINGNLLISLLLLIGFYSYLRIYSDVFRGSLELDAQRIFA